MKSVLKRSCSRFQLTEAFHSMSEPPGMQICDKLPLEVNKLQDCMQQLFPYLSLSEKTNFYTSFFHFCRLLCSVSIFARPLFFFPRQRVFSRRADEHFRSCRDVLFITGTVLSHCLLQCGSCATKQDLGLSEVTSGLTLSFQGHKAVWLPAGVHRLGNLSHTPNVHLSRLSSTHIKTIT